MKKVLITLLKLGISAAIIGWLVYDATKTDVFTKLVKQPKRWDLLVAAWACCLGAVLFTFVRWWYLVRALDIPFRFRDSIGISYWGYLFNLAPFGIVGGDLIKTVMLDRQHPHNRAKALASVLADRVIGLYILFVMASVAILATRFWQGKVPQVRTICTVTIAITVASTVGLGFVLGPESLVGGMIQAIARIPRAGPPLASLIHAVRMYNRKPRVLTISSLLTVPVHGLNAIGFYLIGCGLFDFRLANLSLVAHFVVVPLSTAMQVIPIPMGPTEFAMNYLYPTVAVGAAVVTKGQGLLVTLAYRLICLLITATGIFYYVGHRREMAEVIHEAETEEVVC
ncbi:MAG: lysylphosphatidylglycerol synthase transmembrane domain-containing protein [Thermoguttaceae bacterium]